MRVHLSTLVRGILGPHRRVDTSSHLDILSSIVLEVIGRKNVTIGHFKTTVLLLTVTVDGSTALVGGDGSDTVSGHEGTELVGRVDGGDDGLGLVLCCAGHWLVGQDGGGGNCEGSDEEDFLHEHFCF